MIYFKPLNYQTIKRFIDWNHEKKEKNERMCEKMRLTTAKKLKLRLFSIGSLTKLLYWDLSQSKIL